MIKEAYCSYEVSKLLKEREFDGEFHTTYDDEGYTQPSITHQMACAWLRYIHNIDIDIDAEVGMLGIKVYVPSISTYKPIENTDRVRQRKRGLYYKNDRGIIPAWQHFYSYEEAVEAALKYTLENLI